MAKSNRETLWEERDQEAAAVERAFLDASTVRSNFLRLHGWDYTCDFPDSCWRWVKQYGDQRLMLSEADAFTMEKDYLEPQEKGGK